MHSLAVENPEDKPPRIIRSGSTVDVDIDADATSVVEEQGATGGGVEGRGIQPTLQGSSQSPFSSTVSLTDMVSKGTELVTKVAHKAHELAHEALEGDKGRPPADDVSMPGSGDPSNGASYPVFKLTGGIKNGLVAVNRYYANVMSDYEKQQAIDLLLGMFTPVKGAAGIWEFDLQPQYHRSLTASYQERRSDADGAQGGGNGEGHHGGLVGQVTQDPLVLVGRGLVGLGSE